MRKKYSSKKKSTSKNNESNEQLGNTTETSIPYTDSGIRNTYIVGQNSISQNLPRPHMSMLKGYSYVSIRQRI